MPKPKLLQSLRANLRLRHFSPRTEEAYSGWVRRYVRFHRLRHPADGGEVRRVLEQMRGTTRLAALLLYGSGMRLLECLTLRVKDLDLARGEIWIRRAKGAKDRVTVLPEIVRSSLASQIERVRALHQRDGESGAGWVELPGALARALAAMAVGVSGWADLRGSGHR